jgi:hypothetical protein
MLLIFQLLVITTDCSASRWFSRVAQATWTCARVKFRDPEATKELLDHWWDECPPQYRRKDIRTTQVAKDLSKSFELNIMYSDSDRLQYIVAEMNDKLANKQQADTWKLVHAVLLNVHERVQMEFKMPSSIRTFKEPADWMKEFGMHIWKHTQDSPTGIPDNLRVSARTMYPIEACYKRMMADYRRAMEHAYAPYIEHIAASAEISGEADKRSYDIYALSKRRHFEFYARVLERPLSTYRNTPPDYQWQALKSFAAHVMQDRTIFQSLEI